MAEDNITPISENPSADLYNETAQGLIPPTDPGLFAEDSSENSSDDSPEENITPI